MKRIVLSSLAVLAFSVFPFVSTNAALPTEGLLPLEMESDTTVFMENTPEFTSFIPRHLYDTPAVTLQKLVESRGSCRLEYYFVVCTNLSKGDSVKISGRVRAEELSDQEDQWTVFEVNPQEEFLASQVIKPTPAPVKISENFEVNHEDKVLFTDGIEIQKEVKNAQKATFTEKQGTYAQDENTFYYGSKAVAENTVDDFGYLGAGFAKKNNTIFIAEKVFEEVEDVQTFTPLEIAENTWSAYSKDAKAVYYRFTKIAAQSESVKALGGHYAIDAQNIYFRGGKISTGGAKYLGEGAYGEFFLQDNGGIFLNGQRIPTEYVQSVVPQKIQEKIQTGFFFFE